MGEKRSITFRLDESYRPTDVIYSVIESIRRSEREMLSKDENDLNIYTRLIVQPYNNDNDTAALEIDLSTLNYDESTYRYESIVRNFCIARTYPELRLHLMMQCNYRINIRIRPNKNNLVTLLMQPPSMGIDISLFNSMPIDVSSTPKARIALISRQRDIDRTFKDLIKYSAFFSIDSSSDKDESQFVKSEIYKKIIQSLHQYEDEVIRRINSIINPIWDIVDEYVRTCRNRMDVGILNHLASCSKSCVIVHMPTNVNSDKYINFIEFIRTFLNTDDKELAEKLDTSVVNELSSLAATSVNMMQRDVCKEISTMIIKTIGSRYGVRSKYILPYRYIVSGDNSVASHPGAISIQLFPYDDTYSSRLSTHWRKIYLCLPVELENIAELATSAQPSDYAIQSRIIYYLQKTGALEKIIDKMRDIIITSF